MKLIHNTRSQVKIDELRLFNQIVYYHMRFDIKALLLSASAISVILHSCDQKENDIPTPSMTITDSYDVDYESVTIHCLSTLSTA